MNLISAREAFEKGLTRYFTGKYCKWNHLSERMISNGCCVECLKEKRSRSRQDKYESTKVWRLKNPDSRKIEAEKYRKKYPEKVAKNSKRWREKNLDANRERERLYARKIRATNPEKEKERLRRYNERQAKKRIDEAGREKPELCEICGLNEFRIVFDHCHAKGFFRGWICDRCNRVLGIVKDSKELLIKLKDYLEKNDEQNNHQRKK